MYCFYQLFRLSFWWHPFTEEDPLVNKWFVPNKLIYILGELIFNQFKFLGEIFIYIFPTSLSKYMWTTFRPLKWKCESLKYALSRGCATVLDALFSICGLHLRFPIVTNTKCNYFIFNFLLFNDKVDRYSSASVYWLLDVAIVLMNILHRERLRVCCHGHPHTIWLLYFL